MTDYSYQVHAARKIADDCENPRYIGAALLAAVGSGKTVILTHALNLIVKRNSKAKILFLAHGQNVLKQQTLDFFSDRNSPVRPEFSFGVFKSGSQIEVAIPQEITAANKEIAYSHIIFDEAHEWMASPTVLNKIIKRLSNPKLIVATGSVSIFNRYNKRFSDKPFAATFISGEEMIRRGVFSSVTLDLIKVTAVANTNEILDCFFKKASDDPRALEKPIIVCESIKQATQVTSQLKLTGYSVALSTSENDPASKEISKFKTGECNALVLVNRGILGLNVNLASCMLFLKQIKNPEIVQQALARLYRRHPDGITKFFYMPACSEEWNDKVVLLHKVVSLNKPEMMKSYTGSVRRAV